MKLQIPHQSSRKGPQLSWEIHQLKGRFKLLEDKFLRRVKVFRWIVAATDM